MVETKWIVKFMPAIVILLVVIAGIVYGMGARNFEQGFGYTFTAWIAVEICVKLVVYCIRYFCNKNIGNQEADAIELNYNYNAGDMRRSIFYGVLMAAIVGGMIQFVAQ